MNQPKPPDPATVAQALMFLNEQMTAIQNATTGYAQQLQDNGLSAEAAGHCAVHYHELLVKMILEQAKKRV